MIFLKPDFVKYNSPAAAPKERVIPFRSRRRTVVATKVSFDSGVVWELFSIHIEVRGDATVIDAKEGVICKPTTWMHTAFKHIPYAGLIVGHITLLTNEDLEEIKANPELLNILLDSMDWDMFPAHTTT
ncbi:MAG: hypothetical protein ACYDCN_13200 [Bacteroidia bacterium]